MIDFSGSGDVIAGLFELGAQAKALGDMGFPGIPVEVAGGGPGPLAAHQGGPGRIAGGDGTIRATEGRSHLRQPVDVGRPGLLVSSQVRDPCVEIIDRDEQHIGLLGC